MPEFLPEGGFGLYIHWPFCAAKCPYCDFNSHVVRHVDQVRWANAYTAEIRRVAAETGPRVLSTVFFGGGTPSLMDPGLVRAILDEVRASWPIANDFEVTLEANPTSVEAGRFAGYREAGVNRVSLGIQSLRDDHLARLGRLHSAAEAKAALEIARVHFDRVSFDLIYARQDQSLADWDDELDEALGLECGHLSLYQLTIEPGTAFGDRHAAGRLSGLPNEDLAADLFELTQARMTAAGLPAYETSNHARSGHAARHNLIYWTGGDYAGIGPGAHGRLTLGGVRFATETPRAPEAWLTAVEERGTGESLRQALDRDDQLTEALLMGLRLEQGMRLDRIDPLAGPDLRNNIRYLEDIGQLATKDGRLAATPEGRPRLDAVLRRLLA